MRRMLVLALAACSLPAMAQQPDYESWTLLTPSFPSTGGGGVMIGEYRPVVSSTGCATDFTATMPDGTVYRNHVVFEAVPIAGGVLCTNGRWRSLEGDAAGTTPLEVFLKDGVARRSH